MNALVRNFSFTLSSEAPVEYGQVLKEQCHHLRIFSAHNNNFRKLPESIGTVKGAKSGASSSLLEEISKW